METESRKTARKIKPKIEQSAAPLTSEEAGSFLENIKVEWKLFWMGIVGDDEADETADEAEAFLKAGKLQLLTIEQIKQITRALSLDRKRINQRIEQIQREIESNTERIASLRLVGSDTDSTIEEISKLNDIGEKLSQQLQKVDAQMQQFHAREDELKGL
jgi:prefoldin subunit 5